MRRVLCVLVVAAVAASFTGEAHARRRIRYDQTRLGPVTWEASADGNRVVLVEATISSANVKCVPGRRVEIQTGPSETLQSVYGTGTTDAGGHFSISGDAPLGSYYSVHVLKARIGARRICRTTAAFGQFSSG